MKNNKKIKVIAIAGAIMSAIFMMIITMNGKDSYGGKIETNQMNQVLASEALQDEEIQRLLQDNMVQNMKRYLKSEEGTAMLVSDDVLNAIAKSVSEKISQDYGETLNKEEITKIVVEEVEKTFDNKQEAAVNKLSSVDQSVIDTIIKEVNSQMVANAMTENEIKTLILSEVKTVVEKNNAQTNNQQVAKAGQDGKDGKDGRTPEKGKDYFTESDITTIVKEVTNVIDKEHLAEEIKDSILSDENIFVAAKDGKDGEDGYTPVKGEDYFTASEVDGIISKATDSAVEQMKILEQEKEPAITDEEVQTLIDASIISIKIAAEQNGIKLTELETTVNEIETKVDLLEEIVNQMTGDTSVSDRLGTLEAEMKEVSEEVSSTLENILSVEKEVKSQQERLTDVEDQLEEMPDISYEYNQAEHKITITNNNR